jgi:hypothetical protein
VNELVDPVSRHPERAGELFNIAPSNHHTLICANALGYTVPLSLLGCADEVIE